MSSGRRVVVASALVAALGLPVAADADRAATSEAAARATNEAPRAAFRINPREPSVKQRTRFNGATSTDSDGTIVTYAWDYGDGKTKAESDPVSFHRYKQPGTYTATLTVTDNQGCTAGAVYADCVRSDRATQSKTVTVLDLEIDKPKVKAPAEQVQSGRRVGVEVSAGAKEQVRAIATGGIRIEGRAKRLALAKVQSAVAPKATAQLLLRLKSRIANRRVFKALAAGKVVRATVFVKLVDQASNELRQVRTVRLR